MMNVLFVLGASSVGLKDFGLHISQSLHSISSALKWAKAFSDDPLTTESASPRTMF